MYLRDVYRKIKDIRRISSCPGIFGRINNYQNRLDPDRTPMLSAYDQDPICFTIKHFYVKFVLTLFAFLF